MSTPSKRQRLGDYLDHVSEACSNVLAIKEYADKLEHPSSLERILVQDASIRNLEIIGEALRNIERHYPDYLTNHPELPLSQAYGMRNHLAHGYFNVDLEAVRTTIEDNIPELAETVKRLALEVKEQMGQFEQYLSEKLKAEYGDQADIGLHLDKSAEKIDQMISKGVEIPTEKAQERDR